MYNGVMDWNGDGKMDFCDLGIENGVVQSIADDLEREERIAKMLTAVKNCEAEVVDNEIFAELCREIHIPMSDFDQSDIEEINRRLKTGAPDIYGKEDISDL